MQIKFGSGIAQIATLAIAAASFVNTAHAADAKKNLAPVISGAPATSVVAGKAYSFQPSASDANGDTLVFSVTSKPSWARLDKSTGRLYGTPSADQAGVYEEVEIMVTDGVARTKLPKFSITVAADPKSNRAPTISGTPATTAKVGKPYTFQPTAMDMDGDKLTFSMRKGPSWANIDLRTGRVTGTPAAKDVGTYANIEVVVWDGKEVVALPKFSITVPAAGAAARNVTVSWMPPTENTDGTALTNLSGYRIMYGTESGKYTGSVEVKNVGLTNFVIENLPTDKKYFVTVKATTADGRESAASNEAVVDLT
jgi:putative Ig domain-containing protein